MVSQSYSGREIAGRTFVFVRVGIFVGIFVVVVGGRPSTVLVGHLGPVEEDVVVERNLSTGMSEQLSYLALE